GGKGASTIESLVDDRGLLVDLREEIPGEVREAAKRRVGQVDIRDAASRHLINHPTVVFDPCEIPQAALARNGHNRHGAGIGAGGIRADTDLYLLAGRGFEKTVHVVRRGDVAAIYRQEVLAGHNIDTRLGEGRRGLGVPVLPVVDAPETVAAVL